MPDARGLLLELATSCGFASVRFAAIGPTPHSEAYAAWIDAGRHGEMEWLARARDVRADPRAWRPDAKTAMCMAVEHHFERPPDPGGRTGLVARYAWGRDYHNLVGKRLKKLKKRLTDLGIDSWGGVDTAPVVERMWAEASGIGFQGKNALIIRPARTSWLVLAVLFVDVEAEPDEPIRKDHCGKCARCLDGCPTSAFVGPRVLDATRCISYWTIEAQGLAPEALRRGFGRWVFGCDVCQEVCPHNASPPDPDEDDLKPKNAWLDLDEVLATPDDVLAERFRGTPILRPGPAGLKRNALVALGNLKDPASGPSIQLGRDHGSPVVQEAARWAERELAC